MHLFYFICNLLFWIFTWVADLIYVVLCIIKRIITHIFVKRYMHFNILLTSVCNVMDAIFCLRSVCQLHNYMNLPILQSYNNMMMPVILHGWSHCSFPVKKVFLTFQYNMKRKCGNHNTI